MESDYKMRFGARVEVTLRSGSTLSAERHIPVGAAGRDLEETREAVRGKFLKEAVPTLGEPGARRVLADLERFERLDTTEVRQVIEALVPATHGAGSGSCFPAGGGVPHCKKI